MDIGGIFGLVVEIENCRKPGKRLASNDRDKTFCRDINRGFNDREVPEIAQVSDADDGRGRVDDNLNEQLVSKNEETLGLHD